MVAKNRTVTSLRLAFVFGCVFYFAVGKVRVYSWVKAEPTQARVAWDANNYFMKGEQQVAVTNIVLPSLHKPFGSSFEAVNVFENWKVTCPACKILQKIIRCSYKYRHRRCLTKITSNRRSVFEQTLGQTQYTKRPVSIFTGWKNY